MEYDLAGSDWCQSDGLSGSPADTSVPREVDPVDDQFHEVSVNLTGLVAGTDYCGDATTVTASFAAGPKPPPPPPVKCVVPKVKHETLTGAKRAIKKAHCAVGRVTRVKSTKKNKAA